MDQFNSIRLAEPIEFHTTRPSPCSYLEGKVEQRLVADISRHPHSHDDLARAGFRRVENWVYRPVCQDCGACQPIRIPSGNGDAGGLTLTRSQRRVVRRNRDLARRIVPNSWDGDHYAIFQRYLRGRHVDGNMAEMDPDHYNAMIAMSPIDTVLVEYSAGSPDGDRPVAVMVADIQADGLSAVYSFFEPGESARSLGTFMVLDLAALAHSMELAHVYLGYYVAGSPKMRYKSRFRPAEVLKAGRWVPFDDPVS